ncbi:MAG: hypothetical protein A3I07_01235 [Candidatus Doudnabacteria bacterium RIFCSPLOWO2_02_FULL_42_9]|uniref:Uncharacterized protein n=1 Tax=Candidatus Doudnabacteria bacterium RIFCSPHIGHO2_01_FULL_41_86 TaxID=1817821 RepID=A0A1F5N8S2_9BACT|nr:MAG: hypothetical protein A2717_00800 [Candidatus Doudnabacteria bacterium RIFCSPHIGHO2_01_FULL_41_86]OGE75383.1 MAG: hypothetical protein A3K07_01315 [Candidatus Doudnabacteria bacterium RIFCSPHIGHO2_01_43_10]OGE86591.1 MAG: hypothetical protein A3E28_04255 [Candidatus Doudnabacteria bacterium RIFCSPHIGHO2_12_FULL_42_22]OGE87491.1 MAG: hypothetical protein A3C49_03915 [Candidatus Doudnabacteria bacterium RIFCSPHIGHO2_02_FULL_42_25]OGE92774.1 MAG: hypothetical protein A2895_04600 [Candidatus
MKKSIFIASLALFIASTSSAAVSSSLTVNGDTRIGSDVSVSASCGDVPNASLVPITLSQIGMASRVGFAATVGSNGSFFTTVRLPSTGFQPGPAFLSATCPDGSTIMSAIILSASITSSSITSGDVAGVSTTPVGGVAAGVAGLDLTLIIAGILVSAGIIGLLLGSKRETPVH